MGGVARRNFRLFRKLCGDDALKNVIIVTNMWGDVTEDIGGAREKELSESELFFKPALEKGARMMRHNNTVESAHRIIRSLLGMKPQVLAVQHEVVDENKSVSETAAGQDLRGELERQLAKHKEDIQSIRDEMAKLLKEKDQKHEEEISELQESLTGVKTQLDRVQQAYAALQTDREVEKGVAQKKAEKVEKEMAQKEKELRRLAQQTRLQESKIDEMQDRLNTAETKTASELPPPPKTHSGRRGPSHSREEEEPFNNSRNNSSSNQSRRNERWCIIC